MKINFFTLLLIVFYNTLAAQELPEIPLKNGMAYYVFEHKLDNTKKCLSNYFNGYTTSSKASNYATQFAMQQSG